MTILIIGTITFVILFFMLGAKGAKKQKLEKLEIERHWSVIQDEIDKTPKMSFRQLEIDLLKEQCLEKGLVFTLNATSKISREIMLYKKYDNILSDDQILNIIKGEFFLGMTERMLIDAKNGNPTKIEKDVQKTKTKLIYIYGTKSGGDIFVFHDGILASYKDR